MPAVGIDAFKEEFTGRKSPTVFSTGVGSGGEGVLTTEVFADAEAIETGSAGCGATSLFGLTTALFGLTTAEDFAGCATPT